MISLISILEFSNHPCFSYIERPLFPGLYLTIINNYKAITVPNSILNPVHPIAVAQVKPHP